MQHTDELIWQRSSNKLPNILIIRYSHVRGPQNQINELSRYGLTATISDRAPALYQSPP